MTSLYGLLGVSPDASADEIRRAYYRAARQLHPDVNPEADAAAAMRRLNDAWAVLGDPVARRRYDAQSSPPAPLRPAPFRPAGPLEAQGQPDPAPPHPPRFVRPSALIVAVLLVIFVVTAYAGHGSRTPASGPSPTSTPSAAPAAPANTAVPSIDSTGAANLLGECLQSEPGYDAVVPCGQSNLGEVVMLASASAQCPAGTRAYQLIGRPQWVCLRPSTSG